MVAQYFAWRGLLPYLRAGPMPWQVHASVP